MKKQIVQLMLMVTVASVWFSQSVHSEAANQTTNVISQEYEVIVRSNLRKTPSVEGQWIVTIPDGSIVSYLGVESGGYSFIDYEGVQGYIKTGCISRVEGSATAETIVEAPVTAEAVSETVTTNQTVMRATLFAGGTTVAAAPQTQTVSEVQAQMITRANFRSEASQHSSNMGSIMVGETITILDEGSNGYLHIRYGGQEGYVYSKFVSDERDAIHLEEMAAQTQTAQASEAVYVTSATFGGVYFGTPRQNVSTQDLEVASIGNTVNLEQNISGPASSHLQTITTSASAISNVQEDLEYQIRTRANLRVDADATSERLASIPAGAEVTLMGRSVSGYTMVQYNGLVGYVPQNYVVDEFKVTELGDNPIEFTLTGYCSCRICCGSFSPEVRGGEPRTATGTVPVAGRTIAVDPSVIPYGTEVVIEGMGTFVAEDCGGQVNNNHIDVYFDTHEEALAFGRRTMRVSFVK